MNDINLQAADYVIKHEGFVEKAMWDVNAWRIGHGSDTITLPDGTFRKVKQTDTTTRELARKDLARRIGSEFIPRIKKQITAEAWDKLSDNAKVALVSLAYNYGSITKKAIRDAATEGDEGKLAKVWITSTYDDNKKLPENVRNALRRRRKEESEYILAGNGHRSTERKGGGIFGILMIALVVAAFMWLF